MGGELGQSFRGSTGKLGTCSRVRHQVEDMSRLGVDVEADVHVASRQVDDEVRVVIHWRRKIISGGARSKVEECVGIPGERKK